MKNIVPLVLPLLAGYAELHYHLKYLYPLYYRKEPEIISDLPARLDLKSSPKLPVAVIIKDAHQFPVELKNIKVIINNGVIKNIETFEFNELINDKWFSRLIYCDLTGFSDSDVINTTVDITISRKGKTKTIINDNFPGLSKKPYRTLISDHALNLPDNWFAGDPHYHSNFTEDQVEFGADIAITKDMAIASGLSWFCVTDHSYDLDDKLDDCTKNDPELPKWQMMKKTCQSLDDGKCRVIFGEEVSIGNSKGENVHMLSLNYDKFIEGWGDSAEIWFKNKPQHLLKEIKNIKNADVLFIAAHPFEKVPLAQKLTLRRGNWSIVDYDNSGIQIMQLINSDEPKSIEKAMNIWCEYLLKGKKIFICAGNDAHGNFNVMRQINFPFLTLWETHKQTFGNWMTMINGDMNDPLAAMRTGKMIASNGPFLSFRLNELEKDWQMGETCELRHATVFYDARTTKHFGEIDTIYCYRGDIKAGKEFRFPVACPVNIALPENGYIRMSMVTKKGFFAYTNPIFTKREEKDEQGQQT